MADHFWSINLLTIHRWIKFRNETKGKTSLMYSFVTTVLWIFFMENCRNYGLFFRKVKDVVLLEIKAFRQALHVPGFNLLF